MEVLIIPLIALGVWVLGTVFARSEEPPPRRRPMRPPAEAGRTAPRNTSDLDRFLDEARRRREGKAPQRPEPVPPMAAPVPQRPVPRPEPPRLEPVQSQRTAERRPNPRQRENVPTQPPPRREVPRLAPAQRPARTAAVRVPVEAIPMAEVVEDLPPAPKESKLRVQGSLVARVTDLRLVSPVAGQVMAMLQSPRSAGAAFLLREILDSPRCKRRLM